jgi:hypothetical protein
MPFGGITWESEQCSLSIPAAKIQASLAFIVTLSTSRSWVPCFTIWLCSYNNQLPRCPKHPYLLIFIPFIVPFHTESGRPLRPRKYYRDDSVWLPWVSHKRHFSFMLQFLALEHPPLSPLGRFKWKRKWGPLPMPASSCQSCPWATLKWVFHCSKTSDDFSFKFSS